MTARPPVRWGFLGAGMVATAALAPAVHAASGAVLQRVASRDVVRAGALEPVRAVSSYASVCEADDVDVVYVALPNDAHRPWVLAALAAGKHVLCEKPLGLDAREVQEMREAAGRAGRLLVEATWNRWHPRTRRAEELLGNAPRPREATAWFTFPLRDTENYRLDPVRGGGALLDVGCYAVSATLAALDGPVQVLAANRHSGPTGVDLTTEAELAAGEGRGVVRVSFEAEESQGFSVRAPGFRLDLEAPAFTSWRTPSVLLVEEDGRRREERFSACDPYRLMVESVASRVVGADGWVPPLDDSLAVATVLDEIRRLAAEAP